MCQTNLFGEKFHKSSFWRILLSHFINGIKDTCTSKQGINLTCSSFNMTLLTLPSLHVYVHLQDVFIWLLAAPQAPELHNCTACMCYKLQIRVQSHFTCRNCGFIPSLTLNTFNQSFFHLQDHAKSRNKCTLAIMSFLTPWISWRSLQYCYHGNKKLKSHCYTGLVLRSSTDHFNHLIWR